MAYFYVKSGGTATVSTGKFLVPKTGSWSSAFTNTNQYYDSLKAITSELSLGGFTSTDFIFVSDAHNYSYTTNPLSVVSVTINSSVSGVRVISVDDDDVTVPSPGATETYDNENTTTNFSLTFGVTYHYGIILNILGNTTLWIAGSSVWDTSTFNITENTVSQKYVNMHLYADYINCIFNLGTVLTSYTTTFSCENGLNGQFNSCTFIAPESTTIALIQATPSYGPIQCTFKGCDFSQCNRPLVIHSSPQTSEFDRLVVIGCKESSNTRLNWGLQGGVWEPSGFIRSGIYNDSEELYFRTANVTTFFSVYRNTGASYKFGSYFSKEITTFDLLDTYSNNQFYFKLADLYTDTTNPTTFTVEIAQDNGATALTNQDVVLEIRYPNNSSSKGNFEYSSNIMFIGNTIVISSPTNLPTSSKTWTGLTNPTKQYLSVTTSETGKYGLCSVYLKIFKSNTTFYVCPKVDIT